MRHFTSYRWAGAVVTALGLFATAVAGEPPRPAPTDPINAAKAQQKIAEDKVGFEIRETIDNADKLAKGNWTAKATEKLKSAKLNLQVTLGHQRGGPHSISPRCSMRNSPSLRGDRPRIRTPARSSTRRARR